MMPWQPGTEPPALLILDIWLKDKEWTVSTILRPSKRRQFRTCGGDYISGHGNVETRLAVAPAPPPAQRTAGSRPLF